ncbi:hypothetical protein [Frankia sp. R82]|uniref:hypothetical protein n=1 Tax=Frankia sp. R82 TaxID=2950553 RepID=UPI002044AD33|nr:hypothetical protein [Frankia sp. R82]MCM3884154.1 hypothetical protein [Frankia sp. R82]
MNAATVRRGIARPLEWAAAYMPALAVLAVVAVLFAGQGFRAAAVWSMPPMAAMGLFQLAAGLLDPQPPADRSWWAEPMVSLALGVFGSYWYLVR